MGPSSRSNLRQGGFAGGMGSGTFAPNFDDMDDSALDKALSDTGGATGAAGDHDDDFDDDDNDRDDLGLNLTEQLSKYDTAPPSDVPQREGLYSTPLSWERPQAGLRVDPLLGGLQTTAPGQLAPAEQARLISIALGTGSMTGGLGHGAGIGSGVPRLGAAAAAANLAAAFPYASSATQGYGGAASPYGGGMFGGAGFGGYPGYASGSVAGYGMAPPPPTFGQMMNLQQQSQPQQSHPPSLEDLLEQTRPRPLPPEQSPSRKASSTYVKSERDEMEGAGSGRGTTEPKGKEAESQAAGGSQKGKGKEDTPSDRQGSMSTASAGGGAGGPRADRAAHNDIERKYRTNLKDRIAELRDAIPSLRTIREGETLDDDDDDVGGTKGGGPKVSKVSLHGVDRYGTWTGASTTSGCG
jgi:hypothetical protein